MFYQNYHGVDCFEVGIRQLLDFMGWKSYVREDGWIPVCGLGSCISHVIADDYVVVRTACEFGQIGRPCVTSVFPNFSDAAESARLLTMVEYDCMASRCYEFDMYFCYEVWHVVDDVDFWQLWEHDAEFSRIDAPILLDECVTDGFELSGVDIDQKQLWSLCIPGAGPVSFIWYLHRGELVEELFNADWYGQQPKLLRDIFWYEWVSVEDFLVACGVVEFTFQMLLDYGGGRLGAAL